MSFLMLDRRTTLGNDGASSAHVTCEHQTGISKGWLARLQLAVCGAYTEAGENTELVRQVVRPLPPGRRDRHLRQYVLTEPGLYEADSVLSLRDSKRQRVYFELGPQGVIRILDGRQAAISWLHGQELLARKNGASRWTQIASG